MITITLKSWLLPPEISLFSCLLLAIPLSSSFIFFNIQGIPFLTMSSFLFDSSIDMDGTDSEGSIQQPLMNREVLSISGSSLKDNRHGAFDNKSSSSERLGVLRRIGGGTSHHCERAQPSAASLTREPIPAIVILPSSVSRGARRSGGDIRASPRVCRSHSVKSPSFLPVVAGYDWVRDDVLKYKFPLTFAVSVISLYC